MKIGKIILISFIAASIAFGAYIGVGINKLMQYCYNIVKYKLEGIDEKYVYLKFILAVKNKSDLEIGIKGYFIEIFINNTSVAILSSDKPKTLSGKKTSMLELPIKIDYKKVFGEVKSMEFLSTFTNKEYDKIFISMKGKFNGSFIRIPVKLPIEIKTNLGEIIKQMDAPSEPC